jgi:anti-sigma regulatory factor (Ser/Thr protein kinase)
MGDDRRDGPMTAGHLGTATFPTTAESVADARRWLTDVLDPAHPVCDDAVLLLSEVVTNGVVHSAGGKIEVSVFGGNEHLRIEVVDPGGDTLPRRVDDLTGETGRGLAIVQALARDWGFAVLDHGRLTVWFEITCANMPYRRS